MSERSLLKVSMSSKLSRILPLVVAAAVSLAAGCTESFDGGAACPALCPTTQTQFRDTILDAVSLDSAVGGFPTFGLSATLLLANRPDTLVTRGVFRFDALTSDYLPNGGTASDSIRAIDSLYLRLPLDSSGRRGTTPVTLSVFDVDTTERDTVSAVVRSLFRPDRLLGSLTFTPASTGDSLRVPLSRAAVLAKVRARTRLRVGVQITSGTGQIRIIAFSGGTGAPTLTYDASADTLYRPIIVFPATTIAGLPSDATLGYQVYSLLDRGSPAPDASTLVVGGLPAYRSYLRFAVPSGLTDSGTIVRAELLLTQRPSTFANSADSVHLVPLIPTTTDVVTDVRRILELSAEGIFAALDSTRLVPRDSGVRVLNVLSLVRSWTGLAANQPRALAFRISREGAQPAELRFYSREAAPSLRPRLRITYLPRTQVALP
jgi:hypothetical protein